MARNRNQAVKRARELEKQRKTEDKIAKKQQKKAAAQARVRHSQQQPEVSTNDYLEGTQTPPDPVA